MNTINDSLQVIADLEPAVLGQLADDSYARRRQHDITRITVDSPRQSPAGHGRRRIRLAGARLGWYLPATAATVTAAALIAVAVSAPGSTPRPRNTALTARTFLLTSAEIASHAPTATGAYWYVRERLVEPTATRTKNMTFVASFAETQESWYGQNRARTTVGENLTFRFASAAAKARWETAGSPQLAGPAGFGNRKPVTSNYQLSSHWGVGKFQFTLTGMRSLPVTAAGLGDRLRKMWNSQPDRAAAVGLPHPTFGQYLFEWASVILTGPASPGTRAAIYHLLAQQRGLRFVDKVIVPGGRAGNAVGDGAGDYMIIAPGTAQFLAWTTSPVHAHAIISGTGVDIYEAIGWTKQLGVVP